MISYGLKYILWGKRGLNTSSNTQWKEREVGRGEASCADRMSEELCSPLKQTLALSVKITATPVCNVLPYRKHSKWNRVSELWMQTAEKHKQAIKSSYKNIYKQYIWTLAYWMLFITVIKKSLWDLKNSLILKGKENDTLYLKPLLTVPFQEG